MSNNSKFNIHNQHNSANFKNGNNQNNYNRDYSYNEKNQNHTIQKDHFNMESDYVSEAEEIIKSLDKKLVTVKGKRIDTYKLTTTQIRKLLSLINEIYADILCDSEADKEEQDKKLRDKLLYFKMRCIYEAGRDNKRDKGVADFVEKSNLPGYISFVVREQDTVKLRKKFMWLFHYMEALVAYHRYLGGKDN